MFFFRRKNHAEKWKKFSPKDKIYIIKNTFDAYVEGYIRMKFITSSPEHIQHVIEALKQKAVRENWFSKSSKKITEIYSSGFNKSYHKIIRTLSSDFIKVSI